MNEISIDPYLPVRTVKGFEYGKNENNISFISDYTGVPQVWEVNLGVTAVTRSHNFITFLFIITR